MEKRKGYIRTYGPDEIRHPPRRKAERKVGPDVPAAQPLDVGEVIREMGPAALNAGVREQREKREAQERTEQSKKSEGSKKSEESKE